MKVAAMETRLRTRRNVLLDGLSIPFFFVHRALACDDPPRHYKSPCKAASVNYSIYMQVAQKIEAFRKKEVTIDIGQMGLKRLITYLTDEQVEQEIGIAHISGNQAVEALLAGGKFKIIATPLNDISLDLWAHPSVKNIKDLKGKKIALAQPGYGHFIALESFLKGVDINDSDITISPFPRPNEWLAAMVQARSFDASFIPPAGETTISTGGLTKLGSFKIRFARDLFIVPSMIFEDDRNKNFLVKFIKSIDESILFMQENKDATINFISRSREITLDNAEILYATYAPSSVRQSSTEGFKAVVQDFRLGTTDKRRQDELAKIKFEDIITQEIVKRLS